MRRHFQCLFEPVQRFFDHVQDKWSHDFDFVGAQTMTDDRYLKVPEGTHTEQVSHILYNLLESPYRRFCAEFYW